MTPVMDSVTEAGVRSAARPLLDRWRTDDEIMRHLMNLKRWPHGKDKKKRPPDLVIGPYGNPKSNAFLVTTVVDGVTVGSSIVRATPMSLALNNLEVRR